MAWGRLEVGGWVAAASQICRKIELLKLFFGKLFEERVEQSNVDLSERHLDKSGKCRTYCEFREFCALA